MEKEIFILDDKISFRKCDLFSSGDHFEKGNCTCFQTKEIKWRDYYYCRQEGIHFHCTKHPEIELDESVDFMDSFLSCPKCGEIKYEGSKSELINKCLKAINIKELRGAKLIRINDWYYPELKKKIDFSSESDYWMEVDIKKDKDGDTIVVIYVGFKGSTEKSQFFIKPEKLQLSTDFKDQDPAKVLSRIEVLLKNRVLVQEYDED